MERSELLEKLREDISWLGACETEQQIISHIEYAMKLLKEQEAMRVSSQREYETLPNHYERKGFCPICHQVVEWFLNRSYCGFCGQAVKWDDSRPERNGKDG